MQNSSFPPETSEILGCYVYAYVDPHSDEIFYVGQGIGDRAFVQLYDSAHRESIFWFMVYQSKKRSESKRFALILIGIHKRTNLVGGYRSN